MANFKVPLQSEIISYITEKMKWPAAFIEYYAHRFWNHYQSSGWKLSSGNAMKDWKAAFNSNWQTLKFKEDIEKLQACGGATVGEAKVIKMPTPLSDIQALDKLLTRYTGSGGTLIPDSELATGYDAIKTHRFWEVINPRPTKGECDQVKQRGETFFKAWIVKRTFTFYANSGWRFEDTINARKNLAQ